MPRLYKVGDDRKSIHSSKASRIAKPHRLSLSMPAAAPALAEESKPAKQDDAGTDFDFDRFDYDAFDYGDDSCYDSGLAVSIANSLQSSAGRKQSHASSLLPLPSNERQRDGAVRTTAPAPSPPLSSSSSPVEKPEATKRISNSSSTGMKKDKAKGGDQLSSLKPTVMSPRITHSDLTKNKMSNITVGKRDNGNRKPMGNPISQSSKNGKKNNDENADNHNLQRESTVDKPKARSEDRQPNQNEQRRRHVSFSGKTSCKKSKSNNSSIPSGWDDDLDACLQDTDDDSNEVENVKRVQENKSATKTIRGARRKASLSCAVDRNNDSNDGQQECPKVQILPQRILAIDNRVVPTSIGDSMARSSFLRYIPQLVMAGLAKGVLRALPHQKNGKAAKIINGTDATIIASFANGTKSFKHEENSGNKNAGSLANTSIAPHASYLFDRIDQHCGVGAGVTNNERTKWLADFISPVKNAVVSHSEAKCDGFAAGDSWSYFGGLVEAVEAKLLHSVSKSSSCARSITLFTTDANLFSDTSSSAHVRGVEQFLTRIRRSASQLTRMSTITIMIVESTSIMHLMKSKCYDRSDGSVLMGETHHETLPDRLLVIQCMTDIRRKIEEINHVPVPNSTKGGTTPLNLELEFMEGNAISFQYLLQAWVKESLAQTYAHPGSIIVGGGGHGRLSFDLPETLDGIMCSISLDLQYSTLPHRLDSAATKGLVDEMDRISMISSSSVEVVQTIPLSSVDSSLIYGVPIIAQAGFEKDVSRYDEMKMLVRQLWTYLSRNSVALVLRVHSGSHKDLDDGDLCESRYLDYHSSEEQLFLLISEEPVQKQQQTLDQESNLDLSAALEVVPDSHRHGEPSCNGVLYRYATISELLHFGNEERRLEDTDQNMRGLSEQYLDFIERSLDSIVKTGVNPFLMGGNIIG